MLEYPSRSNLNCLIVVLRGLGRGCRILEPILDCRHPRDRENHYHCGQQWTRTTPVRTRFTVWLPYPNDFCYPIFVLLKFKTFYCSNFRFLYLVVESNHFPLHVKQIRFRYANKVKYMFRFRPLSNIQTECFRTEKWYRAILEIDMSHLRSPDPSAFWWT
jgi:hypothetical protein